MSEKFGIEKRKALRLYQVICGLSLLSGVRVTVTFMDEGHRHGGIEENRKDSEELL